jgi:amino acid transporter
MSLPRGSIDKLQLRRVLWGTEYFTLAFGSIVGVGWMVVLEDWYRRGGSVGAMLGFLLGGLALGPVAYVYGRLAERMPEAGSEVAYTAAVFPRAVSFASGWALTLTYIMVVPWEAVAMGRIAAYSFPDLNRFELYQWPASRFTCPIFSLLSGQSPSGARSGFEMPPPAMPFPVLGPAVPSRALSRSNEWPGFRATRSDIFSLHPRGPRPSRPCRPGKAR